MSRRRKYGRPFKRSEIHPPDAEKRKPFVRQPGPENPDPARGWFGQVTHGYVNGWYAVLCRPVVVATQGVVWHLACRDAPGNPLGWEELQWIKDTIAGPDRTALQVHPRAERLVDGADMYHLWVLPPGFELGFGIHMDDEVDRFEGGSDTAKPAGANAEAGG